MSLYDNLIGIPDSWIRKRDTVGYLVRTVFFCYNPNSLISRDNEFWMFTPISFDARLICRTAAATTRYAIGGLLFANEIRDIKLILIDGTRPAEFMAQHEVSVWVKSTYRISTVDHDFFESF